METKRFILTPIGMQDLDDLSDHFSDPETCTYSADPPLFEVEVENFIQSHQGENSVYGQRWVIRWKDSGRFAGTVGYHDCDFLNGRAEIGFDVARADWRKGVMSECLCVFLPYCFDALGIGVLYAFTLENNQAARGLLEKFDFHQDGVLRSWVRRMGVSLDCCAYSLLKQELLIKDAYV